MTEKKASGFGYGDKSEAFSMEQAEPAAKREAGAAGGGHRILLNIADARSSKIMLRLKDGGALRLTGSPVVDTYRRLNDWLINSAKVKLKDKAVFLRLLSVMLNAGLPLIRSLKTLGVQSEKSPKLSKILFRMASDIENGGSLSSAMAQHKDVFGDAEVGVVKAGEASGQLNQTLKSLAVELEKTASITGKVKGAMVYPIAVLGLLTIAIFLMMILVVPQITQLFTKTGQELPLPTRILIAASGFSVQYWPFIILGVILTGVLFGIWRKTRTGRYILDSIKLKLPVFGTIFQKTALSKFARGFSNMLGSGVPIIKSIEIVAHSIGNDVYKRRLLLTAEDMKRGIPMAENLSESKLFPRMLVNMVEVGEQTAQLENVMVKIADFYDDEVETVVASLTKVMEPLILVVIGLTVGGLVAAIMLPIMQLTQSAGSTF